MSYFSRFFSRRSTPPPKRYEFIQLNDGWNADPNDPDTCVEISGTDLVVSFYMNYFRFEDFSEGDVGELTFHNCVQYRMGTNDEGFYTYGKDRFKPYGVEWGEFYLIKGWDWKTNFPDPIYVNKSHASENLNHYIFYFREHAFECIAESYEFRLTKASPQ